MSLRQPSNPDQEIDMTTNEKIARRKLSLLQLAQDLSNVSRACKLMGYRASSLRAQVPTG